MGCGVRRGLQWQTLRQCLADQQTEYGHHWLYLVVVSAITLLTSFLLVFVAETLRENIPQNVISSEQLLNEMHFWRLAKRKCDMKSTVFKSLSKWDLNGELDNT